MNGSAVVSDGCLALIRKHEGFRSSPYRCPAGVPTIGYGSTAYADGTPVSMADVPITQPQAEHLLRVTLRSYEQSVRDCVRVPLSQSQFDALVSFTYNAGPQALRGSTLLRKLNAGDYHGAAAEFGRWVNADGKRLPGLVRRRADERQLFVDGMTA